MWAKSCRGLARNSTWTRPSQFPAPLSASINSAALSNVSGLLRSSCQIIKLIAEQNSKWIERWMNLMRWFVFCRLNNWRSFGAEKFHTSPGHFILNLFRLDIILFGLLLSQNVVHVKLRLDFLCVFLTARLAAIVLADGGSASVHKWPVPVRALTLFLKCGLMDKLWRTEFFQRSSLALKYGNLSLHQPKKKVKWRPTLIRL